MASRVFANVSTASKCAELFPKTTSACQDIVRLAKDRATKSLQGIYDVEKGKRSFLNTADAMDIAITELNISASLLSVAMHVSPVREIREEASKQVADLEAFAIDHFESNRLLYKALKETSESDGYKAEYVAGTRDKEYSYWVNEQLDDYRRRGMDLPEDVFQKVVNLQKELSQLSITFSQNISEDKTEVHIPAGEMTGVPASILNALKKDEKEDYIVKMDYPTYFAVMKNCEVASTRKSVARAFNNRAYPANESVLHQIIRKRHELALLLGYPSFAHLNLADKMVKSPETAQAFVDDLVPRLQKKWKEEAELLKAHLHPSCVLSNDGLIQSYDIAFMVNFVKETLLNVSETKIQEYFPMDATVQALFDIYQAFFDVTFKKFENGSDLWYEKTSTLEVVDNKTSLSLGFIILDLFPREGKFTHASCHSVVPPVRLEGCDDNFSPALAVVIANFPAETSERPALFLHDDVETFFHEFGHAIHSLMGRSVMSTFAGTSVKRDFVELPSQMLEEWMWEPEILQKTTSHYQTKEALPKDLIDAKTTGMDTSKLFYEIEPRILPGISYEHDTHFECAFGHLTDYGAGYYGYMWSKVFALDVFDYIRSHSGLLDPKMGRRYVDCIIGVGGGQDPNDMLERFLGRKPNSDAFLKSLGL